MLKPICVKCERFFRPKRNGFNFIEGMPVLQRLDDDGNVRQPKPGKTEDADCWAPYKLWTGDLWECPTCKTEIVVGVAMRHHAEHYEPDFAEQVAKSGAKLLVKDC